MQDHWLPEWSAGSHLLDHLWWFDPQYISLQVPARVIQDQLGLCCRGILYGGLACRELSSSHCKTKFRAHVDRVQCFLSHYCNVSTCSNVQSVISISFTTGWKTTTIIHQLLNTMSNGKTIADSCICAMGPWNIRTWRWILWFPIQQSGTGIASGEQPLEVKGAATTIRTWDIEETCCSWVPIWSTSVWFQKQWLQRTVVTMSEAWCCAPETTSFGNLARAGKFEKLQWQHYLWPPKEPESQCEPCHKVCYQLCFQTFQSASGSLQNRDHLGPDEALGEPSLWLLKGSQRTLARHDCT